MKNPSSRIHPELRESAKKSVNFDFGRKNLWLINLIMRLIPSPKTIDGITAENIVINEPKGTSKLRLRLYSSPSSHSPAPLLLWMHGGGNVMGRPELDDKLCAHYVRETGIMVISVDYRLAPRYPFPSGLDDCERALRWAIERSEELGIDASRIAIGGVSAGGGLAAALVQRLHDQSDIRPALQLLIYPMLDDRTTLREDLTEVSSLVWSQNSNRYAWKAYLGKAYETEQLPPYAVPGRRADLSGLPTTWIGVGSLDLFYRENLAYAQRLQQHGTNCELYTVEGAFHGFDSINSALPIVQAFQQSQVDALKRALFDSAEYKQETFDKG